MYCTVHSSDIYFEKVCVGKCLLKIEKMKCALKPLLFQQNNHHMTTTIEEPKETLA